MDDKLDREMARLIRETEGAKDINDVLRTRGTEAFSPELLAKLGPIVHEHDGRVVPPLRQGAHWHRLVRQ